VSQLLDAYLPWLLDLLELGGPILAAILVIAVVIWALLAERTCFLLLSYPRSLAAARAVWTNRAEQVSWFAQQQRADLITTLTSGLASFYPLIATLIKVCPLLGLLGTVLGMLEVFDALAATGSNNPRSMAAGVSKATVSTLAGMVVAIGGLLAYTVVERRASAEQARLSGYFSSTVASDLATDSETSEPATGGSNRA
jgi:biopolymer transport protein ExbB